MYELNDERWVPETVKEYYGKILTASKDLKTSACCTADGMPPYIKDILKQINPEVLDKFYGCGSPIPHSLEGCTVLDLGCGSGRDCFILSKLVGPSGKVIGIDMTVEQLETARRNLDYHTDIFGYKKPNIAFHSGYIENLKSAGVEDDSIDLVISNCVINLSPDKPKVFSDISRVLKPGGELYFSDIFAGRRIPGHLAKDPVLFGECLGGALYLEDFRRIMEKAGFTDHRQVAKTAIELNNQDVEAKAGMIDFHSVTVRAFKLETLEDRCEDYGQVAFYRGTIKESPHSFILDDHHVFNTGMPVPVCGNTASMLQDTRYSKHFKVTGDKSVHYGLFVCGDTPGGEDSSSCC